MRRRLSAFINSHAWGRGRAAGVRGSLWQVAIAAAGPWYHANE